LRLFRVKILYHHRIKSRDGQYIHIRSLIEAFKRSGHPVEEVGLTARESYALGEESPFWKALVAPIPGPIRELLEYAYSLPAALWLWSRILRIQPDFIYERYALGNFAGVLAARWARIPIFLEVNSPLAQEKFSTGDLRFPSLARFSERRILESATRVLVVSNALKEIFAGQGIDLEKLVVIPNGIDPGHYDNRNRDAFREKHGLGESIVLGFVGFFREWHRLDLVLELMARDLSGLDLKLLLVGDGPVRPELEKAVKEMNIADRVIWTGILDHEEVPSALAAMDIAVQSDVTDYASPLKLIEYMAAARAIVAPRKRNIQEIIRDGETGLLFEAGNLKEMGDAMRKFAVDPELRERLGRSAREHLIRNKYTWDSNADRVLEIFEKV
jgi:glycosyltransferase involved in cell wall biosynthesis